MFAADTDTFLADYGSATSWTPSAGGDAVADLMLFDQPEDVIDGGDVLSRGYQVTYATATWPGLKRGEVLVIDGEGGGASYRLRTDPKALDDGVFCVVGLTKV